RERGIEGRSPDKAEGRIRGNWAPITDARARDILVPGCASLTRATQVHRDRWRLQNPNPSPRLSQRERGIEGRSPDKAEGRIRGMGGKHGYSGARHPRCRVRFAYPGYAGTPRPAAPAEPEPPHPPSPNGRGESRGVARRRPEAASGEMGANHGYSCARLPRSRVRFAYPGSAGTPRPVAPAEPEPSLLDPPTGEGNRGGSPDKAEGRIRG